MTIKNLYALLCVISEEEAHIFTNNDIAQIKRWQSNIYAKVRHTSEYFFESFDDYKESIKNRFYGMSISYKGRKITDNMVIDVLRHFNNCNYDIKTVRLIIKSKEKMIKLANELISQKNFPKSLDSCNALFNKYCILPEMVDFGDNSDIIVKHIFKFQKKIRKVSESIEKKIILKGKFLGWESCYDNDWEMVISQSIEQHREYVRQMFRYGAINNNNLKNRCSKQFYTRDKVKKISERLILQVNDKKVELKDEKNILFNKSKLSDNNILYFSASELRKETREKSILKFM